jgi:DNA helicase-2/ATP-dependent DNA helicase PcrA
MLTPRTSGEGTECQLERNRKLAYVCFSRAEENLKVILFTQDHERAKSELIASAMFKVEQILIHD